MKAKQMAVLTITTTTPQDVRIVKAYGTMLGLGRNATAAEVKAHVISEIRQVVMQQETLEAQQAITVDSIDLT